MNIFSDYPDIINVALIPMIIAIFALGLPLLIQTITRIDDKYKSPILIEVFRKELITKVFLIVLLTSIFSYILWFLQIPSCVNWGWAIDNSALIFVIINTVSLIPKIPCFCNHIYSSLPDVLSLPLKVYGISRRSKTSR